MSHTNLPTLESTTKCTLKFNDISYIPMDEKKTVKLFSLLADREKQFKIRKWLNTAEIKIIHFNNTRHIFKTSDEILLNAFWSIINKVVNTKDEYKLTLYRNLLLNIQRNKTDNWEEIELYIQLIEDYSKSHIEVLQLINKGILDYLYYMNIPPTNTIPSKLAECIEYAIPELARKYEMIQQIWNDLLETGLRKEANLYMWMSDRRFVCMFLTTDLGKKFLLLISKCG